MARSKRVGGKGLRKATRPKRRGVQKRKQPHARRGFRVGALVSARGQAADRKGEEVLRFNGEELWVTPSADSSVHTLNFCPTATGLTRLDAIADQYDLWRIVSCELLWKSASPATQAGRMLIGCDYDPVDVPTAVAHLLAIRPIMMPLMWESDSLRLDKGRINRLRWMRCSTAASSETTGFLLAYQNGPSASSAGDIWCRYVIEFTNPKSSSVAMSCMLSIPSALSCPTAGVISRQNNTVPQCCFITVNPVANNGSVQPTFPGPGYYLVQYSNMFLFHGTTWYAQTGWIAGVNSLHQLNGDNIVLINGLNGFNASNLGQYGSFYVNIGTCGTSTGSDLPVTDATGLVAWWLYGSDWSMAISHTQSSSAVQPQGASIVVTKISSPRVANAAVLLKEVEYECSDRRRLNRRPMITSEGYVLRRSTPSLPNADEQSAPVSVGFPVPADCGCPSAEGRWEHSMCPWRKQKAEPGLASPTCSEEEHTLAENSSSSDEDDEGDVPPHTNRVVGHLAGGVEVREDELPPLLSRAHSKSEHRAECSQRRFELSQTRADLLRLERHLTRLEACQARIARHAQITRSRDAYVRALREPISSTEPIQKTAEAAQAPTAP
jgi:hypothetical protein